MSETIVLSAIIKNAKESRDNLLTINLISTVEKELKDIRDNEDFLEVGNTILYLSTLIALKSELLLYLFSLEDSKRKKEMSDDTELMEIFSIIQKSISKKSTFKKAQYVEVEEEASVPLSKLSKIVQELLERESYLDEKEIKKNNISIKETMQMLKEEIKKKKKIVFQELFSGKKSRLEIVLMFIAVLMLAKSKFAKITQKDTFAPIYVIYNNEKRRIPLSN
jgi:chromatin segregation and condensation protein Rec8/ScpA/Scc1 (kleisin family)